MLLLLLSGPRLFIFINCSHEEGKQATRAVGMKSVTKCYACKRRRQKIHFHVVHVNLLDTPGEERLVGELGDWEMGFLLPLCE